MTVYLVALIAVALTAAVLIGLSADRACTGGGKGTGEPVRCEP